MKHIKWTLPGFVLTLALALTMSAACTQKESQEAAEKEEMELPAAVSEVVKAYFPNAQIDKIEVAEEYGITLYDIEFKADQGEIEVAVDGTILDVVTIITMDELPKGAAEAIQKAAEGATILRLEKSEIHSVIKEEEGKGTLVKLDSFRYVYEAELMKDGQTGEVEVDADGNITEPLKWDTKVPKKKD
ncbi:MAG: hypothetical protein PVI11_08850 [Candidatus Aminicenantes bacterium]|jgi:uncharacterized membrane protein YkoI